MKPRRNRLTRVRPIAAFFLCLLCLLPGASRAEMNDYPIVKLQSLDKITARTMVFEAKVGSTIKFGPIFIKIQACRKAPPIEKPESASFLQIWENVPPDNKAQWIFSGWMFASSPALSAMDHPVYDVWVIDCLEASSPPPSKADIVGRKESAAAGEEEVESVTDSEGESGDGEDGDDDIPH